MSGVLRGPEGTPLTVGGKTGTGENRHCTAAFVLFIGERCHGVVTAYVPGAAADDFSFTSSLTTQLLRELAPVLEEPARGGAA